MMEQEIKPEDAIAFLREASRYFEKRSTGGEDLAHWSNVYNSSNCNRCADLIEHLIEINQEGGH